MLSGKTWTELDARGAVKHYPELLTFRFLLIERRIETQIAARSERRQRGKWLLR